MKSGRKWYTNECGRCGHPHKRYSGKWDKNRKEYVICQRTNKKMFVRKENQDIYITDWRSLNNE